MKRTISVMVGKGSVNHNSRQFHAKNTDPERSDQNMCYCHEPIEGVYHQLFDEALKKYNAKQKKIAVSRITTKRSAPENRRSLFMR